jgi:hypothetical protein
MPEPMQTRLASRKTDDSSQAGHSTTKRGVISKTILKTSYSSTTHKPSSIHDVKSTKNIVKNYGRAICNFILSPLFIPYFNDIIKRDCETSLTLEEFREYINERKELVDCMDRFKEMLIPSKKDSQKQSSFKKIFKEGGIIFIKYFSVNWIYHGRVTYKEAHLYFRHKMLRRLQNPELFTYLKSFSKK